MYETFIAEADRREAERIAQEQQFYKDNQPLLVVTAIVSGIVSVTFLYLLYKFLTRK